jgi:chitin synthase
MLTISSSDKGFRSIIVLAWMFTNLVLIIVVLQVGGSNVLAGENDADSDKNKARISQIYLQVVSQSPAVLLAED